MAKLVQKKFKNFKRFFENFWKFFVWISLHNCFDRKFFNESFIESPMFLYRSFHPREKVGHGPKARSQRLSMILRREREDHWNGMEGADNRVQLRTWIQHVASSSFSSLEAPYLAREGDWHLAGKWRMNANGWSVPSLWKWPPQAFKSRPLASGPISIRCVGVGVCVCVCPLSKSMRQFALKWSTSWWREKAPARDLVPS